MSCEEVHPQYDVAHTTPCEPPTVARIEALLLSGVVLTQEQADRLVKLVRVRVRPHDTTVTITAADPDARDRCGYCGHALLQHNHDGCSGEWYDSANPICLCLHDQHGSTIR